MEHEKLRECPFCGSEKVSLQEDETVRAICGECGALGPPTNWGWLKEDAERDATADWNIRAVNLYYVHAEWVERAINKNRQLEIDRKFFEDELMKAQKYIQSIQLDFHAQYSKINALHEENKALEVQVAYYQDREEYAECCTICGIEKELHGWTVCEDCGQNYKKNFAFMAELISLREKVAQYENGVLAQTTALAITSVADQRRNFNLTLAKLNDRIHVLDENLHVACLEIARLDKALSEKIKTKENFNILRDRLNQARIRTLEENNDALSATIANLREQLGTYKGLYHEKRLEIAELKPRCERAENSISTLHCCTQEKAELKTEIKLLRQYIELLKRNLQYERTHQYRETPQEKPK